MINPNVGELSKLADSRVAVSGTAGERRRLAIGSLGLDRSFLGALPSDSSTYIVVKRCLDIALAGGALLALSPVLLIIAIAVKVQRQGPVLYRQPRIGLRGRRFHMFKFTTMRRDRRDRQSDIEFRDRRISLKTEDDPRVTPVGRILRKTSLDELPQLVNVLNGDMSLVGPRPEQPEMLKYYRQEHYQRHVVTPGLTGWWQINSRCRRTAQVLPQEDLDAKLADDLYYLDHRSFFFDLQILFRTPLVVLLRRGAF